MKSIAVRMQMIRYEYYGNNPDSENCKSSLSGYLCGQKKQEENNYGGNNEE